MNKSLADDNGDSSTEFWADSSNSSNDDGSGSIGIVMMMMMQESSMIMNESSRCANANANNKNKNNTKKSVHFRSMGTLQQIHSYEGVHASEVDGVWYRRTEYVEFVENELRRRQLLSEIESTIPFQPNSSCSSNCDAQAASQRQTDNNRALSRITLLAQANKEATIKHTFSPQMVSRQLSAGPPRRRRRQLPGRERNDMDDSFGSQQQDQNGVSSTTSGRTRATRRGSLPSERPAAPSRLKTPPPSSSGGQPPRTPAQQATLAVG